MPNSFPSSWSVFLFFSSPPQPLFLYSPPQLFFSRFHFHFKYNSHTRNVTIPFSRSPKKKKFISAPWARTTSMQKLPCLFGISFFLTGIAPGMLKYFPFRETLSPFQFCNDWWMLWLDWCLWKYLLFDTISKLSSWYTFFSFSQYTSLDDYWLIIDDVNFTFMTHYHLRYEIDENCMEPNEKYQKP